ncbi:tetratricopeptide repeat protein, partial [Acinetobacter baumannii]
MNMGVILALKNDYKGAIKEEEQATELNPKSSDVFRNLGNIYADSGDLDNAVKAFKDALKLSPKHPKAHSDLGAAL